MVVNNHVVIEGCIRSPVDIEESQGGIDGTVIITAEIESVHDDDLLDGIPKIDVTGVPALGIAIQMGLEPICQERPGEAVIAGIDIGKIIINEIMGSGRRNQGRQSGRVSRKGRRDAGGIQSREGAEYTGLDETINRKWRGGGKHLNAGGNPHPQEEERTRMRFMGLPFQKGIRENESGCITIKTNWEED